jgi:hypothetical protein
MVGDVLPVADNGEADVRLCIAGQKGCGDTSECWVIKGRNDTKPCSARPEDHNSFGVTQLETPCWRRSI